MRLRAWKPGWRTSLTLGVLGIEGLLLFIDQRLDLRGWAPSIGANLLTMLATVFVVERLLERDTTKRKYKLAARALSTPLSGMLAICHRTAEGLLKQEKEALAVIEQEKPQWKEWAAAWPESVKYMTAELEPDMLQRVDDLEDQMMDLHRMKDRGHGPVFLLSFYANTMIMAWHDARRLVELIAPGHEPYIYFIEETRPLIRALERRYDLPTYYDAEGKPKKDGAPLSLSKATNPTADHHEVE